MFKETEYSNLTKSEKALKSFAEKLIFISIVCFFIGTLCYIGLFIFGSNSSALMLICGASFIVMGVCFLLGAFLYGLSIADHVSL